MKRFSYLFFLMLLTAAATFTACSDDDDDNDDTPTPARKTGTVRLMFENVDGSEAALAFESVDIIKDTTSGLTNPYVNANGDSFTVNYIRYWVSNITLTSTTGQDYTVPDGYYLIEKTPDNERQMITLQNVPEGEYNGIQYAIGVDEAPNGSLDLKAGELDETVGMSWTWNTGYIFFKMQGRYKAADGYYREWRTHIGTDANYKPLSAVFDTPISVTDGSTSMVHTYCNPLKALGDPSAPDDIIDFNQEDIMMVGPPDLTAKVADNYAAFAFELHHVE